MVIWERVNQPRAARGALNYARIARAAVELADEEGLDAVSMRKVAARLGAGTMSLYRYVDSRDDLVHLMADQVYGEAPVPGHTGDWRHDLTELARRSRAVALRHPWLAGHSTSMDSFGPNMLAMMEDCLALLESYGLSAAHGFDVWGTVQSFVEGFVLEESAAQRARARTGLSKQEWRDSLSGYLDGVFASGRFPRAARAFGGFEAAEPEGTFERRLGYLLDGISPAFTADGR